MSSLLLLLFYFSGALSDLVFAPYKSAEQYKCGSFMEDRNGRKADVVLSFYYNTIDQFISLVSSPFPHQDLLTNNALTGDIDELQSSVEKKYWQWIEWQKGWIGLTAGLVAVSVLFVVFYVFYKFCACICSRSAKKQNTDARYDGCKRSLCNLLLFGLVSVNAFVAFTLLMTSQYAQIGLDKLPNRMNQCIDDLQAYKRDSDMRIRKLLIEDFQVLNTTMTKQISTAGHNVVDRVKKLTGAHAIDVFMNVSKVAQEMHEGLESIDSKVKFLNEEGSRFEAEFSRLRNTANEELVKCLENELEPVRSMCANAERLLESLSGTQFKFDSKLFPETTEKSLAEIVNANITEVLAASNSKFTELGNLLQHVIDKEEHSHSNQLKQMGDELFIVAETISTQLRQVNFDSLYNSVAYVSDVKKTPAVKYIQYSWYVSLAVTSLFILLALLFLFGVLYGICGRRPTYYNDDCCVRTTGGKFYSFGIWVFLLIFVFLAVGTAIVMFSMGNFSNLVCQPLRNPLSRPDSLSLAERYMNIYKAKHTPKNDIEITLQSKSPAEIIRGCARNETLYNLYDFEAKYKLNKLNDLEKYREELLAFVQSMLARMPEFKPIENIVSRSELQNLEKLTTVNVSQVSQQALNMIKHSMDELDLVSKIHEFEDSIDGSGKPKAVTLVLEQVRELESQFAKPLKGKLESLYQNVTDLNQKMTQLQVPVSSLIVKLQHAQALIAENMKEHFDRAVKEETQQIGNYIDQYYAHVKQQMESEVTSCQPLTQIARQTTAAICSYTIDPYNGTWMCMLICLTLLVPIVVISNSLITLYAKMHAFPKYTVEPPSESHHMSSFITDTYDTRPKPGYANYTYTDDYQRTYR